MIMNEMQFLLWAVTELPMGLLLIWAYATGRF